MKIFWFPEYFSLWIVITLVCGAPNDIESNGTQDSRPEVSNHEENTSVSQDQILQEPEISPGSVPSKLVTVDLDITKSTDDFEFIRTGYYSTYTPKFNNLFNKIVMSVPFASPVVIWEANDVKEYANEVYCIRIGGLALLYFLTVHMINGDTKWFKKNIFGTGWKIGTIPFEIELYTDDGDGNKVEMDPRVKLYYYYSFGPDSKCSELKHKGFTVWKHQGNGPYPKSILYMNTRLLSISLTNFKTAITYKIWFTDDSCVRYILENNAWKQIECEQQSASPSVQEALVSDKLVSLDIESNEETDSFQYEFCYFCDSRYGRFRIYTSKKGFKFSSVKEHDSVIWDNSEDPSELSNMVVTQSVGRDKLTSKQVIVHTNKDNKLFYRENEGDLWSHGNCIFVTNVPGFKVLTLNDDGSTSQNNYNNYLIQKQNVLINYIFKPSVKCVEIKFDDDTVWKYSESEHGHNFPTKISVNNETKGVRIFINNIMYIYNLQNGEWKLVFEGPVKRSITYPRSYEASTFGLCLADDLTRLLFPHSQSFG
eukprot:XP_765203.1 hypothetical protein [Theileria parva strain Muguga]